MVTVLLDPDLGWTKEQLVPAMRAAGIDVRPLFYPLSQLPAYRDSVSGRDAARRNKTAYEISPYGLNLPSGPDIDRQSVERAVKVLLGILASRPI
jgi:perosamine synthetase